MKNWQIAAVFLAALMAGVVFLNVLQLYRAARVEAGKAEQGFFAAFQSPVNVAHRGASGSYPENTLQAFHKALAMGADVLELDVWKTADGEIVVLHDKTVDRTTDGEGYIGEMTLKEVKELDAAYHFMPEEGYPYRGRGVEIPTLKEVFEAFPEQFLLIELKGEGEGIVREVARLINKYNAKKRVVVGSFNHKTIKKFRAEMPEVPTAAGVNEALAFYVLSHLGVAGWINWDFEGLFVVTRLKGLPVITAPFKAAANCADLYIYVWTINDPDEMEKLIEAGVHGVITDYPYRLRQVIEGHK